MHPSVATVAAGGGGVGVETMSGMEMKNADLLQPGRS